MSIRDLIDLLCFVAVYAPNNFPDDEEDTLDSEKAFTELRERIAGISKQLGDPQLTSRLSDLVNRAEELYQIGNERDASSALIEAQSILRGR